MKYLKYEQIRDKFTEHETGTNASKAKLIDKRKSGGKEMKGERVYYNRLSSVWFNFWS